MSTPTQNILHTGGDPRALPEFIELRHETAKTSHNSRKEIDWQRVEELSIALFRRNGMDLQSVAWYTMARAWRTGLAGLCEGLEIVTAMMKHQWSTLWPHPLPARLAIITWLSAGIQQVIRALSPGQEDLPLLHRLETQLDENVDTLEKLAQKHLSQLDWLKVQVSEVIGQIAPVGHELQQTERSAPQPESDEADPDYVPPHRYADGHTPLIYVPRDLTSSTALNVSFSFWERSRGFFAGMMVMLILGSMAIWGYQLMQPIPGRAQRMAILAQQITPQQVRRNESWQQTVSAMALPSAQMQLWQTAQFRLQRLGEDLDAMDTTEPGWPGLPEVKARVVTIQQPLQELMPVEELLRRLEKNKTSPVLRGKIEHRLKQLLARYALILSQDPKHDELY
ncbi:type VI secretion system ImpA family N-terminal domain-containing protein [Erwinia papayae]|uniref:Type VI secretion system ImpA family N-terminal domain-containing protein n=1 Tax=Erwinia papayae TaxID=206499 RepID=A0ABV3MVM2_9GAMM